MAINDINLYEEENDVKSIVDQSAENRRAAAARYRGGGGEAASGEGGPRSEINGEGVENSVL